MRPSIIFFDEIDGLAPVRSTRQDQIHSSIVSTLLALMDGLDSRGEIVVIGATNRIDAIDPALRRPGRFDREFRFPLPSREVSETVSLFPVVHTDYYLWTVIFSIIVSVVSTLQLYVHVWRNQSPSSSILVHVLCWGFLGTKFLQISEN